MYIFGCQDTTTVVMDFLPRSELRSLLCINSHFSKIKENGYYSIRIIQDFIKKNKTMKCHQNRYNCKKITFQQLYKYTDKYIGKTIQFLIKYRYSRSGVNECGFHYTMWHCKLGGITLPYNYVTPSNGIVAIHVGHIQDNIHSTCKCQCEDRPLNNENTFTFFNEMYIYPHSLRIISD